MKMFVSPWPSCSMPSAVAALSSVRRLVVPTAQTCPPAARTLFTFAAVCPGT